MPQPKLSRRDFVFSFTSINKPPQNPVDPLFDKYARHGLGPRVFNNGLIRHSNANDAQLANRVGNVLSGLTPYTGTWTTWEVLHLLRHTGHGFKKSDADLLSTMTVSDAVDAILNIDNTAPTPPLVWYNNTTPDENGLPDGADWTNDAFNSNTIGQMSNANRSKGLSRWLLDKILNQDYTIKEKMIWFWYHFIPVDFEAVYQSVNLYTQTNSARICYQYMKMFRDNPLSNFKTLIRNVATQPSMMYYLNNQANSATAPDENFARELMELFTLGKDPLSQYTQDDVIAAAQVLTGWRVQNLNTNTTSTVFDPAYHKTGNKQFSSFFNNTVIADAGAAELDAFINMIFSKTQVVSEYICRRLYRYFVYYDIDANIEANVITPLAQTFVANNWDIIPVLKQLFKSEHFFDVANRGVYIKSPLDLVGGTLRIFNIGTDIPDQSDYESQYLVWQTLNDNYCFNMQQAPGSVPNVSGWPAFYQQPAFHEYWINSSTIQKRFFYLERLIGGITSTNNGNSFTLQINPIAFAQQFPNSTCQDPNLLIAECIKYLLPVDLSSAQQATLKLQTLLNQQVNDSYWTSAWNNYIGDPANTSYENVVTSRLKNLLYTLIELAEFQLM